MPVEILVRTSDYFEGWIIADPETGDPLFSRSSDEYQLFTTKTEAVAFVVGRGCKPVFEARRNECQ